MQMLNAVDCPVAFDESRLPDPNNPKGYYELDGGKIINRLMNGSFPFVKYRGRFVKITAYGLKYLPRGRYKIIYSERNIEEILDSMEKMAEVKDAERDETKKSFIRLNVMIKNLISTRDDCDVLFVNYNKILSDSDQEIQSICAFLNLSVEQSSRMVHSIDKRLYRQRHGTSSF
jgi:hypothetical protein